MFDTVEIGELAGKAAGGDVTLAGDEALLEAAKGLQRARTLLDVAQSHVLAELDARGVTDREFGHRTGTWLGNETRTPKKKCRAELKAACKAVRWFPGFDAAAADGLVTSSHVELLCRVANVRNRDALAEVQQHLVTLASQFPFEHWASLLHQLASELDEDGGYDPNDDILANRLRLSPNGDHTVEVSGRLVGDARTTIAATLESVADELFRRFARDQEIDSSLPIPDRPTLMALALAEVCLRAGAVDVESTEKPRVEAVIVLREGADGAELTLPDGQLLPPSAANLLTDAFIRPLVVDDDNNPLRYGRSRRFATPAQRTAVAVRDGGCVFPGCDMPPGWCDLHHPTPFAEGGLTDTDEMSPLCRHHHGVVHRSGWTMKPDPDRAERWIITTPSGRTLRSQRRSDLEPPRPDPPGER